MTVPRWTPWTDGERREVVRMARAGSSAAEIAAALGRTVPGVKHALSVCGVRTRRKYPAGQPRPPRDEDWTDEEINRACELRRAGHTVREIAAAMPGRTAAGVWNLLRRKGVPCPPPSGKRRTGNYHRKNYSADWHEPTEAELDAMIAEQLKPENLPAWWAAECARVAAAERGLDSELDAVLRESSRVRRLGAGVRVGAGRRPAWARRA